MNELLQQYKNEAIEEGRALGLEQGLEQGLQQGQAKGRLEAMRLVIDKGFLSIEQAAEALGMTAEELQAELNRIQSAD